MHIIYYLTFQLIFGLFFGPRANSILHEFHLSKAIVKHNVEEKALQVSLHIYIDDLEASLLEIGHDSLFICTKIESNSADSVLYSYLTDELIFSVGDQELQYTYIGKEVSEDLAGVWIYLEVYEMLDFDVIEIKNNLLMDVFQDQQNIMHVRANGKEKYLRFDVDHTVQKISWK